MAAPARPGVLMHRQSDGTVVGVRVVGDEFGHYVVTEDGCAVALDEETGDLCYAYYEPSGRKVRTDVAYGRDRSGAVAATSRQIPFSRIGASSALRRSQAAGPAAMSVRKSDEAFSAPKTIVLLAQFKDLVFTHERSRFENMLKGSRYNFQGASGSALEYFKAQFGGTVEFVFDLGPVVTLSREYAYYGEDDEDGNDLRAALAVAEACILSDDYVDFSKYDCIYVFYAGGSPADMGADDNHIWPHSYNLPAAGINLTLDGRRIGDYAMSSELMNTGTSNLQFASIGTFCHEYSHTLGLPDLYDVDYEKSGGKSPALWGSISLMDSGNYNNDGRTPPFYGVLEREILGLTEPEEMAIGQYELEPISSSNKSLKIDTDTPGEYFLVECRRASGWDEYIGGSGLLVYHIDKSDRDAGYSERSEMNLTAAQRWSLEYNEINARPDHQCADLIESHPGAIDASQVFFPNMSRNVCSSATHPSFCFWDGAKCPFSLASITKKGDGSMSFVLNGPISLDNNDVFQDAAIISWHTDVDDCKSLTAYLNVSGPGCDGQAIPVKPYEDGKYSYTLENLVPGANYDVTICYLMDGDEVYPHRLSFKTDYFQGLPFICMGSSYDGTSASRTNRIPLRVINARGAKNITWTLDGREIHTSEDGYYHVKNNGLLKAVVDYADGTSDILVKELTARW